jgi:RNA polymerase sigma-70 factor, ECF subfamily
MAPPRVNPYGANPMALEPSTQATTALDRTAFARAFDESMPRIYALVASRVGDRAAAEEITAATFRRALDVARDGLGAEAFGTFALRVAATAIVDHVRRERGAQPRGGRASDFDQSTDAARSAQSLSDEVAARALIAAIDRRALRRAIQDLPAAQRRLVVLRYLDALTVDEQCALLGWSRDVLARRVHGALRALHAALREESSNAA